MILECLNWIANNLSIKLAYPKYSIKILYSLFHLKFNKNILVEIKSVPKIKFSPYFI